MPSHPIAITRTIYDPALKNFVFDSPEGRAMPNIRQWIDKQNPVIYWYILRVDNPSELLLDQWAIELYTHQALNITDAYIDGIDRRFELKKRERDPWSDKYVLSIPKQLGIPIVGRGTRRIFFKVDVNCREGLMHEYGISGKFIAQGVEVVDVREKMFRYSCKVGEFRQIFDNNPDEASIYAEKRLSTRYSSNSVLVFTNSFRMIHDLCKYCNSGSIGKDDLLYKLHLLHSNFEKVPEIADKRINPLLNDGIKVLTILDEGNMSEFKSRYLRLCDSLVEQLHIEVLGANLKDNKVGPPLANPLPSPENQNTGSMKEGSKADNGKRECPLCMNLIDSSNRSLLCGKCGVHFCQICESWFREERKRGERPLCENCFTAEKERLRRQIEEERIRKEKEEQERLRKLGEEERIRKEKEVQDRLRKQREEERIRKEKEEQERLKKQREEERIRKEKEVQERLKKQGEEERIRKEKEEAARNIEEIKRKAQEEADRRKEKEEQGRLKKQREEERIRKEKEVQDRLRKQREEEKIKKEKEEQDRLRKQREEERIRKEKEELERLKKQKADEAEKLRKQREALTSEDPKTLTSRGIEFVQVPAGDFMMGSNEYNTEQPVRKVTIRKPFFLSKYPVTQKQWKAVIGSNPSKFKGDDLPVERVSLNDVQEFVRKLNGMEGTDKYRLPSEAEWEYACRAGTTTRYYFGDDESKLGDYAWYRDNSNQKTHPVGQKKPNPWGLYDMHGNVWEWCQDGWHDNYNGAPSDGSPWEGGNSSRRVLRGGCWSYYARRCRSALRYNLGPGVRSSCIGFRVLRKL